MAGSLWTSLHEWNLITPMRWVGLDNYAYLLTSEETRAAFGHTLYFIAGYLPLVYAGGLGLAMLLNQAHEGPRHLPGDLLPAGRHVVGGRGAAVEVAAQPGLGHRQLGDRPGRAGGPGWWTDPDWAMPSIILASAWKDLGFVMIILLAGLQAIPKEYVEAARVDGAERLAAVPPHHPPAAVPQHVLRRRHLADQRVPGLRPGLRHDRRRTGRRDPGRRRAGLQPDLQLRPRR